MSRITGNTPGYGKNDCLPRFYPIYIPYFPKDGGADQIWIIQDSQKRADPDSNL